MSLTWRESLADLEQLRFEAPLFCTFILVVCNSLEISRVDLCGLARVAPRRVKEVGGGQDDPADHTLKKYIFLQFIFQLLLRPERDQGPSAEDHARRLVVLVLDSPKKICLRAHMGSSMASHSNRT